MFSIHVYIYMFFNSRVYIYIYLYIHIYVCVIFGRLDWKTAIWSGVSFKSLS